MLLDVFVVPSCALTASTESICKDICLPPEHRFKCGGIVQSLHLVDRMKVVWKQIGIEALALTLGCVRVSPGRLKAGSVTP